MAGEQDESVDVQHHAGSKSVGNKKWKSEQSNTQSYVCFINRTTRRVNVIWVDYEGYGVRYYTLEPRKHVNVNTFVGHPWVFWDRDSGDRLVANMQDVYHPVATNCRLLVVITIPVFKLVERCIQVMRYLIPKDRIPDLDIPRGLKDEILRPIPWKTPVRGIYEPQTQTVQYIDDIGAEDLDGPQDQDEAAVAGNEDNNNVVHPVSNDDDDDDVG